MNTLLTPLQQAFIALQDAESRAAAAEAKLRAPIAIVGLACRAPGGVRDAESFWRLLDEGRDAIGPISDTRWDHDAFYDPDPNAAGKIITRSCGLVDDVDQFDAEFFGISPREADGMDPQQRMLLEVCWETLENAGQAPDRLRHTATGVYIGAAGADYSYLQLRDGQSLDSHFASGVAHSVLSGRVSYLLGLQGPSLTVDTACSSSLVAVHLACQALRSGECQLALAGGVNVILSPDVFVALSQARMLAADGRCKPFSAGADGFGRGEGCGIVALKLLADAEKNGDRVLAVIRGSAINQDGPSSGLTVPNGPAQEAVIHAALTQAQIEPHQVSYVEAHGTGTELGDPLEARALSAALCVRRAWPLLIGSVKSNVGHLEGAAGVIGLIKLVLSLQRGTIPRSLHCAAPSRHIAWDELALRVVTDAAAPWPTVDGRRIGGVSSFGFSGTNAHLIVEAAPATVRAPELLRAQFLPVSAHTGEALVAYASALRDAVTAELSLVDVARTLGAGRAHRKHRAAILVDTISAFRDALNALANCRDDNANVRRAVTPHRDPPRLAFLFTGQGAQYPGMGAALYATMPAFRAAFDRCDAILLPLLGASLRDTVLESSDAKTMAQTGLAQPALFVLEYALAETLRSVGVTPVAVIGHSVGELVAACVAGAIALSDALRLVAARGALMQALPAGGAMTAVFASESQVAQAVAGHAARVSIAALNGPMQTVISGHTEAVAQVCAELAAVGIKTQPLTVSHAFHSPLIEPVMAEFEQRVAEIAFAAPQLVVISNVTGQRLGASELASPKYWSRHLREPVRFADGLKCLTTLNVDICVELGPHPTLTTFAAGVFTTGGPRVMPTLRRGTDDRRAILDVLSELYLAGVEIDWRGLDADRQGTPIALPTSPFVRRRHWFRRKTSRAVVAYEHPLLGHRVRAAVRDLVLFEAELDVESADFIADHVVHGRSIMPAAAMIEMALGACIRSGGAALGATIQSFVIAAPLTFEHGPRLVQTLVRMESGRPAGFEILSSAADNADKTWTLHAQGEYVERAIEIYEEHVLPPGAREISAAAHYDALADLGLTFGNSLKLVQRVHAAPNLARGEIAAVTGSDYTIAPTLLDACIQVMAAAPEAAGEAHLPISIDRVSYAKPPVGVTKSDVVIRQAQSNLLRADVLVSDAEGIVMQLEGIALRPVRAAGTSDLYRVEWRETSATAKDASWTPTLDAIGAMLDPLIQTLAQKHQRELEAYQAGFLVLERASVRWILRMFAALGWCPSRGERATAVELCAKLGVGPRYRQLLRRYLDILTEDGVLRCESGAYSVVAWPTDNGAIDVGDPREPRTAITRACAEHLSSIVTEQEDPLQHLFPNGSAALTERLYRESPEAEVYNTLLAEIVARVVANAPVGHRVRILEVGAGTGGSTSYVAPRLRDADVDYVFTDLGAAFVARAQESFSAYPFMSFQQFNLELAPDAQGLARENFDIIIASNCVHATANLKQTLAHLRSVLAPGGLLLLLEMTGFERWIDLTFALTEGWWRFSDFDLRPDYPLLDSLRWERLLEDAGFAAASIGETLCRSRQTLIGARKPIGGRAQKIALIGGTEALQQDLGAALIRRGHSVSFETLDLSTDIVAYLEFIAADQDDPLDTMRTSFEPLLSLVQRLGAHGGTTRLVLVTRGAAASSYIAPVQAAALGFVRTASAELGELRPALVDLDPDKPADVQIDNLVSALLSPSAEPEQALRDNAVLASRLTRVSAGEPAQMHLRCGDSGMLDDLVLTPAPRPGPQPGQLEIRATASSLNFRDVMNALSMRSDADPLGGECAGVVSAVGAGVKDFAVGDNVVALASGAFATYVLSDASFVVKQPRGLTDCQAAALPLVTMTAQHALVDVARLRPGQTVLIHAGAGGVGMAAMQIAKRCGARIFATAGTEQKRSLLGKLGAARTFSSRTLDFEREIAIATDGRGVEVILNSLAGPFIEASVRSLAARGSFLEIGKSGILSQAQFHAMRPDACYTPLDLATMPTRDRAGFERLFRAVMADAASEVLKPLPVRVFPLTRAKEAFSFMAHARHVGKVVLRQDRLADGRWRLDPNGVYLITGAYGGIGFATAERLFERGVRGLVLIGRMAPSGEVKAKLDAWRAAGAQIQELTGDISSPSTVADVFARIDACGRPLRGVIHSAGELSDGALLQQNWERFEPPLRAKVRGAWLLHRHTKARRLEFFALFSSVAATLGAPGQTNHAVANAFMDALAHYRRERGLPATSLAWGAWSKLGAAAARGADARAAARGAGVITPARGLDILEILIADAPAHVAITPIDWRAFLSHWAGKPPLFYTDVASESPLRAAPGRGAHSARKDDDILRRLQQSVPSARRELLAGVVAAAARHVLGGTGDVDPARPLSELGLDSLLAVELRNRLGTILALSPGLPATVVFDCPTVDLLVAHLMARLWPAAEPSAPESTTALGPMRVADNVDDLSDAEVDAMFERMVGR